MSDQETPLPADAEYEDAAEYGDDYDDGPDLSGARGMRTD